MGELFLNLLYLAKKSRRVLVFSDVLFVLNLRLMQHFNSLDKDQALDYALDLKNSMKLLMM